MLNRTTEMVKMKGDSREYVNSLNHASKNNKNFQKSVSSSGKKLMYMNQALQLAQSAVGMLSGAFNKIKQNAMESADFFSQISGNVDQGIADVVRLQSVVDGMIDAKELLRTKNLLTGDLGATYEEMEAIFKASVKFARQTNQETSAVLSTLTQGILRGTDSALAKFGISIETTGSRAEKSKQMLAEFARRFGDVEIAASDASEMLDKNNNEMDLARKIGYKAMEETSQNIVKISNAWKEAKAHFISGITGGMVDTTNLTAITKAMKGITGSIITNIDTQEKFESMIMDESKTGESFVRKYWDEANKGAHKNTLIMEANRELYLKSQEKLKHLVTEKIRSQEKDLALQKAWLSLQKQSSVATQKDLEEARIRIFKSEKALKNYKSELQLLKDVTVEFNAETATQAEKLEVLEGIFNKVKAGALGLKNSFMGLFTEPEKKGGSKKTGKLPGHLQEVYNDYRALQKDLISLSDFYAEHRTTNLDEALARARKINSTMYQVQKKYTEKRKMLNEKLAENDKKNQQEKIIQFKKNIDFATKISEQTNQQKYQQYIEDKNKPILDTLETAKKEQQKRIRLIKQNIDALDTQMIGEQDLTALNYLAQAKENLYQKLTEVEKNYTSTTEQLQQKRIAIIDLEIAKKKEAREKELQATKEHQKKLMAIQKARNDKMKSMAQGLVSSTMDPMITALAMTDAQMAASGKTTWQMVKEKVKAWAWETTKIASLETAKQLGFGFAKLAIGRYDQAGEHFTSAAIFGTLAGTGLAITKSTGGVPGKSNQSGSNIEQETAGTTNFSDTSNKKDSVTVNNFYLPNGAILDTANIGKTANRYIESSRERGKL